MTDLLAEEPLVIARLQTITDVPGFRAASSASIAGTHPEGITALCPVAFVHPGPSEITAELHRSAAQAEELSFEVVTATKLIPDPSNLAKTYLSEAGPLLKKVEEKLVGWVPADGYGAVRYAGISEPDVHLGHVQFGLRFKVRRLIESAN